MRKVDVKTFPPAAAPSPHRPGERQCCCDVQQILPQLIVPALQTTTCGAASAKANAFGKGTGFAPACRVNRPSDSSDKLAICCNRMVMVFLVAEKSDAFFLSFRL